MKQKKFTKIVATVGPACSCEEKLGQLIDRGVDVFRLNFSHGSHEEQSLAISKIRAASEKKKTESCILMDLQGPKIRVGKVADPEGMALKKGDSLTITTGKCVGRDGKVSTVYPFFAKDVSLGNLVLVDDGQIHLIAIDKNEEEVVFEVQNDCRLMSNKGINLPNIKLSTPALTEKDLEDLKFGLEKGVDMVALSFVRHAEDIDLIIREMEKLGRQVPIISKIEKPEAVEHIDEIIEKSYGIMIARGDLGIEVPEDQLPIHQKSITKKCNKAAKPVIIATQMLDSMIRNPIATRAEITDIANAILDGADALMLSGETSVGSYPLEAVDTMRKVILSIECEYLSKKNYKRHITNECGKENIADGICLSAVDMANGMQTKAIACVTHTGSTARKLAKFRPFLEIYAVTNKVEIIRRLKLSWGVKGFYLDDFSKLSVNFSYLQNLFEDMEQFQKKDRILITAGIPTFNRNTTNCIKIYEITKEARGKP